ncbi:MAG TPA: dipeptide ABC transporter ATP-binding protein [Chloroflexota bacterium]|jgi:oligopeptide/dipeptide ABC transporter ATP-binding protein|nr:dipeptide ABC transporter ATP-binding protein [Chloroflexota bacterium]
MAVGNETTPAATTTGNGKGDETLVSVQNLKTYFPILGGIFRRTVGYVQAVDDVSFDIKKGETFGLVGESGCGKTTTGRTILRLNKATGGKVVFDGKEVFNLSPNELKRTRKDMQIIFQDPYSSLNPRMPVGDIIGEGLRVHGMTDRKEREKTVQYFMSVVGLRKEWVRRYPHEFSGGQRQRIGVARALALRPKFIVCDEPVSALDVSVQSQVINLLEDLQKEFGLTYLFIAHDLSVVEYISDRVGVMYLGKLAELAPAEELYRNPLHPYTKALLSAIPNPDPTVRKQRIVLQGDVPSPINPPSGCRFRTRCPIAIDRCASEVPAFRLMGNGHYVACHRAEESTALMGVTGGALAAAPAATPNGSASGAPA